MNSGGQARVVTPNPPSSWADGLPARLRNWPVERQCLIHLLRAALGTGELRPEFRPLGAAVPVLPLLQEIRRHRVGALLDRRLPAEIVTRFQPELAGGLQHMARQNQRRALRQTAELVRLAKVLAQAGVPVMSLKGPLLAEALYGGQGVRHAGDIDFSIAETEVAVADRLLRNQSFRRVHPPGALTPLQWKHYARVWRDCEYRTPDEQVTIEVMWRLANHDALQGRAKADPAVDQVIGGQQIRVLPPSVHGVYLLVHGANHGWFRLFWLVDIAILMNTASADWKEMRDLAVTAGVDRHFWQGLHLAREILGAPWPAGLEKPPLDHVLGKNIEDAYWQLELSPQEIKFGKSHVRMSVYAKRLMPDRTVRWRELSKHWISPANWQLMPLSDRFFWLYYLIWPGLWLWRQLRQLRRAAPPSDHVPRPD